MDLKKAIEKRKSVKRYMDKKPNWRKVIRAIDLARHSPTAGGQFAMKFIMIFDEDKITKLAEASQQDFIGKAKCIVVAVSDDSKLVRSYGEKGTRYASQQAGAAIQNFLLGLTQEGLATTWVGHFYEDQIKETLSIPKKLTVEAIFPIGKETKIKTEVSRKPKLENLLYFEKWKSKKMNPPAVIQMETV